MTDNRRYNEEDLKQIIPLRLELNYLKEHASQNAFCMDEAVRIKEQIEERYSRYSELISYIDSIEDSRIRTLLRLRFIEGLTYRQIGFRFGKYDESGMRKVLRRFLDGTSAKH